MQVIFICLTRKMVSGQGFLLHASNEIKHVSLYREARSITIIDRHIVQKTVCFILSFSCISLYLNLMCTRWPMKCTTCLLFIEFLIRCYSQFCADLSVEDLMNVPAGRKRKYHDDVTVIVILLGNKLCTLTASTSI